MSTLRFSVPGDEPGLKALWEAVFGDDPAYIDPFFREIYVPGMAALAEEDGGIVSAAYAVPFGNYRYIYAVATLPAYRGRGLGRAVTLLAADGKPAFLCPAEPSLFHWYQREMNARPVSRRNLPSLPEDRTSIEPEEFARRREILLAGTPHPSYSPGILALFSLGGEFFLCGDGSVGAAADGVVKEYLPAKPGGETYILGLNGAEPLYWGLTLD